MEAMVSQPDGTMPPNPVDHDEHAQAAGDGGGTANTGGGSALEGRKIRKKFGRKYFYGTVSRFEPDTKWYKVTYDDGDSEELEWGELEPLLMAEGQAATPAAKKTPKRAAAISPKSRKKTRRGKPSEEPAHAELIDLNTLTQDAPLEVGHTAPPPPTPAPIPGNDIVQAEAEPEPEQHVEQGQAPDGEVVEAEDHPNPFYIEKESSEEEGHVDDVVTVEEQHEEPEPEVEPEPEPEAEPEPEPVAVAEPEPTPKRKRGRPRKSESTAPKPAATPAPTPTQTTEPKKRGRKRKSETAPAATDPKSPKTAPKTSPTKKPTPRAAKAATSTPRSTVKSMPKSTAVKTTPKKSSPVKKTPTKTTSEQSNVEAETFSPKSLGRQLQGRKIRKDFDGTFYDGQVQSYNRKHKFYKIHYEDGDEEELVWKELEPLLLPLEEAESEVEPPAAPPVVTKTVKVLTIQKRKVVTRSRPATRSSSSPKGRARRPTTPMS